MAACERQQTHKHRRKMPSFSSSLLDAIYHSIDEPTGLHERKEPDDYIVHRRNNAAQVDQEIESLRRAIRIEKWMNNYSTSTTPRHLSSNSGSSTDSSFFSSSETESSAPKRLLLSVLPHTEKLGNNSQLEANTPKREGRFTRTKSRALKIYGDLKKAREPISPGGKIANFLNSIFSPRNLKKNQVLEEWGSVRKSRSMKDTMTSSSASRSCLNKNPNKSKRSVRFCPVSVILDEDSQPCGHKTINADYDDEHSVSASVPSIGSQFIKKNMDSLRRNELRGFCEDESEMDDKSCASSDLFELENIGRVGIEEELPVYGTTSVKMNKAIASGLIM